MTETLINAAILIPCLIIAIVFHEVAHGWTALALGDPTAQEQRRLSLNPIRHVDPVGTLLVPGALALMGGPIFGWAKPVPVQQRRLKNPRYGMMLVAAAGPATNIILGIIGAIIFGLAFPSLTGLSDGTFNYVLQAFQFFIIINIFLALFNLLPIPPFDGSHIVQGLLPRSMAGQYAKLQQMGMFLLIALIAATWAFPQAGIIENTVGVPVEWLYDKFLRLSLAIAGVQAPAVT
ncbi:site-2 protease family protein [Pontixanthobacter gangjinensis]|uniref:Site-2 protease family protein n=1 Tax=Pontixanthobacter gangjinensis TaxID=1028742 RepID=A0A6I4SRS8_9SPHN|nr:site-2 protease family protein [Pontixanthobacter gangjinensis]MXO57726.1 site-2 protease family protein [Pontixanthobacter gangjinensis]